MNTIKRFFVVLTVLPFVLAACSGAEAPTDAKAPSSIPPSLDRTSYEAGAAAKALIDELLLGAPASDESWAAVYGDGPNEIMMAASGFADDAAAFSTFSKMEAALGKASGDYKDVKARTIEYQPGLQMRDDKNRYTFVFTKGRWVVAIRTIVQNLPSGVTAVEWVPAATS